MKPTPSSTKDRDEPALYEIRLKGHLDERWTDWFDGLTITQADNSETVLTGLVADQAALHGLLRRVRDLGLPLLSVTQVGPTQADESEHNADMDQHRSDKEKNT